MGGHWPISSGTIPNVLSERTRRPSLQYDTLRPHFKAFQTMTRTRNTRAQAIEIKDV